MGVTTALIYGAHSVSVCVCVRVVVVDLCGKKMLVAWLSVGAAGEAGHEDSHLGGGGRVRRRAKGGGRRASEDGGGGEGGLSAAAQKPCCHVAFHPGTHGAASRAHTQRLAHPTSLLRSIALLLFVAILHPSCPHARAC